MDIKTPFVVFSQKPSRARAQLIAWDKRVAHETNHHPFTGQTGVSFTKGTIWQISRAVNLHDHDPVSNWSSCCLPPQSWESMYDRRDLGPVCGRSGRIEWLANEHVSIVTGVMLPQAGSDNGGYSKMSSDPTEWEEVLEENVWQASGNVIQIYVTADDDENADIFI